MATVPDIPLALPVPGGSTSAPDPLSVLKTAADLRSANNANALFQQQWQARQKAGMIISHAGDEASAVKGLLADPTTAAYAGEYVNFLRSSQATAQSIQGQQQQQNLTGLGAVMNSIAPVVAHGDTGLLDSTTSRTLSVLPDPVRKAIAPAIDNLKASMKGLPPEQARQLAAGTMVGAGASTDTVMGAALSRPTQVDTGDAVLGGSQDMLGGGLTLQGAGIRRGIAPTVLESPTPEGGKTQNLLLGGGGPNALTMTPIAQGPSAVQSQVQAKRGSYLGDIQTTVDNNVATGIASMRNLQEAGRALEQFKPGTGAAVWQNVAKIAGTLGAPQEMVDKIAGGNYAAGQEFQKLMVNNTMNMIQQMPGMQGHIAQQELFAFMQANPNIETDPRAVGKLFDFASRTFRQSVQEQKELRAWVKEGKDLEDWPTHWAERAAKLNFYSDDPTGSGEPAAQPSPGKRPPLDSFFK